MKNKLFIGLIAFVVVLGTSCKKDELNNIKQEQKKADLPPLGSGPGGPVIGPNPFGLPPNGHEGISDCVTHDAIPGVCNGTIIRGMGKDRCCDRAIR